MKKVLLSLALVGTAFTYANAQGNLDKGNSQINAGVGFSGWGVPVYAGFDYGVTNDISLGAEASFVSRNYVGYNFSVIGIGVNGNYHFNEILNIPEKMDFYAGVTLGYYIYNSPSGYAGTSFSGIGWGGQVGFRYFFTEKFGVNLHAGGGTVSGGRLGVTFKL